MRPSRGEASARPVAPWSARARRPSYGSPPPPDLGQFYRCRDGELIRDRRDSKIATVEHFVAKARTAWRVRITAFDAFLNAYARHVGALDYLTGDAYEVTASIARPDATGWRSEPWGALA